MLRIDGSHIKDEHGRTIILRGVNLGGSTKVPYKPDGASHRSEGFFDHRNVSFVGRPFPLEEADEHLSRLRAWGFTFLRFLVTWEAVEHAGPGQYDEAYLDYLQAVVAKAAEHDIDLYIDPHQDVWSRFSGGDGAPGWTLASIGLNVRTLHETGAAIVHQIHGDPFPRMIWPSNGGKLAAATMFALFFGGNDFAPGVDVAGEPVQEYFQRHYIAAMQRIAARLKGFPNVLGYGTMNEPSPGYIEWQDLNASGGSLRLGPCPSPYQAMLLGSGMPQSIDVWGVGLRGERIVGAEIVNPQGVKAWLPDHDCVWRRSGVWDINDSGHTELLRPDHFRQVNGVAVDFERDYYRPFADRFAEGIRSVDPDAAIFIETDPAHLPPYWGPQDAGNIIYAPHWYDGYVLLFKDFKSFLGADPVARKVIVGSKKVRRSFAAQVGRHKKASKERLGGVPVLIGEFGIAYDMHAGRAYRRGDFRSQVKAMDRSFRAMEDNLVGCTLWNYTADNTNERGDQWNGEDLSIFSRDQQTDPEDIHSGGRALQAVVRPYARAVSGEPMRMSFDYKRGVFEFEFRHDPHVHAPTELFVPQYQFPKGCRVEVSDGSYDFFPEDQRLLYRHDPARPIHFVRLIRVEQHAKNRTSGVSL